MSVILPHQQRSWIGKAHFVGQVAKPTYFRPGPVHQDDGTTHDQPSASKADEEWVLINGTPATCTQLGLYHFFQDQKPVDLVISGPNYGRNSTSLFCMSSGTIGGAMEAALFRKKAVALSFAFHSREHDPKLIAGACRQSAKIIEHLCDNWVQDVDLYTINVPVIDGVEERKIFYTNILQNYWPSGTSFEEVEASDYDINPENQEMEIRQKGETGGDDDGHGPEEPRTKPKHFKWAPRISDLTLSIDQSPAGNDGWAIKHDYSRFVFPSSDSLPA